MNENNARKEEKAPCKDCLDRKESCWGKCEKYKAWKIKFEEVNQLKKEYLEPPVSKYKKLRSRFY